MEADEVDLVTAAVFGDFEQIEDAEKSGGAGKLRRNVGQADGIDGLDFDVAFFHRVTSSDFDAWNFPNADAKGYFAAADSIAEAFGEHHGRSLRELSRSFRCVGAGIFEVPPRGDA